MRKPTVFAVLLLLSALGACARMPVGASPPRTGNAAAPLDRPASADSASPLGAAAAGAAAGAASGMAAPQQQPDRPTLEK